HSQKIRGGRPRLCLHRQHVRHGISLENLMRSRLANLFGLRAKVLLVALVLLAIPWVGYDYVKEMERLLRAGQEQNLVATARAIATALHDRPQLLQLRAPRPGADGADNPATSGEGGTQRVVTGTRAASEEIGQIIKGLGRAESRIWAVDRNLNLLAIAGSLKQESAGGGGGAGGAGGGGGARAVPAPRA